MQEYLRRIGLALIIILWVFLGIGFIKDANAQDYSEHNELVFVNQSGGVVAVVAEPCQIGAAIAKGFTGRAYATENNGTVHEGCWLRPDISDAPNTPSIKIIPIVNLYFDEEIVPIPQHYFHPITPDLKGAL